jgi:hypothetical protein
MMNERLNPYRELIEYLIKRVDPEVLLEFRLSADVEEYALDLLDRYKEHRLSAEESSVLDVFVEFDGDIGLWKSEAMLELAEREPTG